MSGQEDKAELQVHTKNVSENVQDDIQPSPTNSSESKSRLEDLQAKQIDPVDQTNNPSLPEDSHIVHEQYVQQHEEAMVISETQRLGVTTEQVLDKPLSMVSQTTKPSSDLKIDEPSPVKEHYQTSAINDVSSKQVKNEKKSLNNQINDSVPQLPQMIVTKPSEEHSTSLTSNQNNASSLETGINSKDEESLERDNQIRLEDKKETHNSPVSKVLKEISQAPSPDTSALPESTDSQEIPRSSSTLEQDKNSLGVVASLTSSSDNNVVPMPSLQPSDGLSTPPNPSPSISSIPSSPPKQASLPTPAKAASSTIVPPPVAKPKTTIIPKAELVKWNNLSKTLPIKIAAAQKEKDEATIEREELLVRVRDFEKRRRIETEAIRGIENTLKVNIEALEQKNKSLIEMIDQADSFTPASVSKEKQAEVGREQLKKQVADKYEEASTFEERYRMEYLIDRELGNLKCQIYQRNREIQMLEETVVHMKKREQEARERAEKEGTDPLVRVKTAKELEHCSKQLEIELKSYQKIESELIAEEGLTLRLSKEVEELQSKEKQHELALDSETKFSREEAVRIRKDLAGKEHRFKENERANEELRRKVNKLEGEIKDMADQLRIGSSGHKITAAKKTIDHTDRRMAEGLVLDVQNLKSETDKIKREKGRLEVIIKDLTEKIELKDQSLSILTNRSMELDFSRDDVAMLLITEEKVRNSGPLIKMGEADLKRLMEKVVLENIYFKKKLKAVERPTTSMINSIKS